MIRQSQAVVNSRPELTHLGWPLALFCVVGDSFQRCGYRFSAGVYHFPHPAASGVILPGVSWVPPYFHHMGGVGCVHGTKQTFPSVTRVVRCRFCRCERRRAVQQILTRSISFLSSTSQLRYTIDTLPALCNYAQVRQRIQHLQGPSGPGESRLRGRMQARVSYRLFSPFERSTT